MKVLVLGDPHGKLPKNLDKIVKKNKVELVVCVGEIPNVPFKKLKSETENKYEIRFQKHYREILKKLDRLNLPVFLLKGNEMAKGSVKLIRKFKNLKYKKTGKIEFNEINFILFDMIWEDYSKNASSFTKKQMRSNSSREKRLNKLLKENPDSILITHAPPYGYVDEAKNSFTNFKKKHVGSKIILKAIKKNKLKLVLCGHIHEAKGKAKLGKAEVYNLGSHGDYAVFDIGEKIKLMRSNFLK